MDMRFTTPLAATQACNVEAATETLGIAGAKLIEPGAPGSSLISIRAHALGLGRMPPLASRVVDDAGLAVVDTGSTRCRRVPERDGYGVTPVCAGDDDAGVRLRKRRFADSRAVANASAATTEE